MNQHDQDPHDWLTAQFSDDDDDLDDENAGTDAADADASDPTAQTALTAESRAAGAAPATAAEPAEPAAPGPPAPPAAAEAAATAASAASAASEQIVSAPEPMRRASSPVAATGASFTWGLRPTGGPLEREPDAVVPVSFFPVPAAARPAVAPNDDAPQAAAPVSAAAAAAAPVSAASAAATAPVSAAAAAAPVSAAAAPLSAAAAPVSAAAAPVSAAAPPEPARPFYPPPPAISRTTPLASEPFVEPVAALTPSAEPTQPDGTPGPTMSIAEVLDAPSPRRAAREVAAREEAAREAATRGDLAPDQPGADEPHDDGIDDPVDPHAPFTPQSSGPFTPQSTFPFAAPGAAGTVDPVRVGGTARFDLPVVPTADGPAIVGRAQAVASRDASTKAASSRTQKILLLVGLVLVVALGIVLIFVLAQRTDAAALAGPLHAGGHLLAEAARHAG